MEFSREIHRKALRSAAILTSSYVSNEISTTLDGAAQVGANTLDITSATNFSGSGVAVIDAAGSKDLIKWTSKSGNTLQGVTGITVAHSTAATIDMPTLANMTEYNTIGLEVDFTKGSATTIELKIEVSTDGLNYYQQIAEATSSGTVTVTLAERQWGASGTYSFLITPIRAKYWRVSVKGSGTLTNSSATILATWSWS